MLRVVNIADPAAPFLAETFETINTPVSAYVEGNYAYVGNSGNNVLEIIDISTVSPPENVLSVDANGNAVLMPTMWKMQGADIYNQNTGNIGIGTASPGSKLTVAGIVESDTGGFKFPDGTIQTSAATADNLGNHTAVQNIQLNNNWLSNDGDSEGISIDSNGFVGVGAGSPVGKLTVADTMPNAITIKTPDNSKNVGLAFQNSGSSYTWNIFRTPDTAFVANLVFAGGNVELDPDSLTERMRIDESGNVGIATNDPLAKLHIGGIAGTDGIMFPDSTLQTTAAAADHLGNHTATQNVQLNGNWLSGDGDNEGIYIDSNGYTGIGIDTPTGMLTVQDTMLNTITIKTPDNTKNNGLAFQNSGNSYTWNIFRSDVGVNKADLVFAGGNISPDPAQLNERLRIDQTGNVLSLIHI